MRAILGALALLVAAPAMAGDPIRCGADTGDGPVIMVVRGLIHDRERLMAYGRALAASGLYPELSAYYLNAPQPVDLFEGEVAPNESLLMVRFPCLEAARAFWHSRAYQEGVVPQRRNPDAGIFHVSVYREADIPAYMKGRVTPPAYAPTGAIARPEQVARD